MKLGRLPRTHSPWLPSYSQVRAMSAVPLPALLPEFDNGSLLPLDIGMMRNDREGDCAFAAMGHMIQLFTRDALGKEYTLPDDYVQGAYSEVTGYDASDPTTDRGTVLQKALHWWYETGVGLPDGSRHKLLAPAIELDVRSFDDVCEGAQEFGAVYIGFDVMREFMFAGPPMDYWRNDPSYRTLEGGHCVAICGANRPAATLKVMSWGSRSIEMDWAFWQRFVDEAYVVVDPWWITTAGRTPLGLTQEQLTALGAAVGTRIS
jgi:hypothetical protein